MGNSVAPGNCGLCVKQQFGMKFNLPPPPFLWLLAVYVYVARTVSTHFPRKACKNVREKGNFQFPVVKNRPLSAKHCFGGNWLLLSCWKLEAPYSNMHRTSSYLDNKQKSDLKKTACSVFLRQERKKVVVPFITWVVYDLKHTTCGKKYVLWRDKKGRLIKNRVPCWPLLQLVMLRTGNEFICSVVSEHIYERKKHAVFLTDIFWRNPLPHPLHSKGTVHKSIKNNYQLLI